MCIIMIFNTSYPDRTDSTSPFSEVESLIQKRREGFDRFREIVLMLSLFKVNASLRHETEFGIQPSENPRPKIVRKMEEEQKLTTMWKKYHEATDFDIDVCVPSIDSQIISEVQSIRKISWTWTERVSRWEKVDPQNPREKMSKFLDRGVAAYVALPLSKLNELLGMHLVPRFLDKLISNPKYASDYKFSLNTDKHTIGVFATFCSKEIKKTIGIIEYGFDEINPKECIHRKFISLPFNRMSSSSKGNESQLLEALNQNLKPGEKVNILSCDYDWIEEVSVDITSGIITINMKRADKQEPYFTWQIIPTNL